MSRTRRKHSYFNYARNVETYIKRQSRFFWHSIGPEDVSWYLTLDRDGKQREGNASRHYRKHTNAIIRRSNRANAKRILFDPESVDDIIYADKKDGKFLSWLYW